MFLPKLNTELSRFQNQLELTQQNHLSGTSPLMWEVFQLEEDLDENVKALLSYFLPLKNWITSDWKTIAQCFQQILNTEIEIQPTTSIKEKVISKSVEKWRVGMDMIVGGERLKDRMCVQVNIFPKCKDELILFLKGGEKRKLLEEVLCKFFLPKKIDYVIEIVMESKQSFQLTWKKEVRVGLQTYIVAE